MKKLFLFTVLSFFVIHAFAEQSYYAKAKVNSVNVYRNAAQLQNSTSFTIPSGISVVVIGNISDKIIEKTLQIGLSNKNIVILSSQFTNDYVTNFEKDIANPQIKKATDSIKIVESLIEKSNIEFEANTKAVELLDKNQTVLVGSNTSSVAQLTQLTDFYTNKRIELSNKLIAIKKNNEELQKKLTRLKSSLKTKEEKEVEEFAKGALVMRVMNNASASSNVNLEINYLAQGVTWNPIYEVKGNSISEPLDLILKANVRQSTGLDWKGVKLSLINGIPSKNNTAPEVQPWFLSQQAYDEDYKTKDVVVGYANKKMENASVTNISREVLTANTVGFNINSNQLNVSYDVDVPYDIQSNGEDHLISLFQQKIPAEYTYYTAPNYNNEAYLLAKVKDFSKYGLVSANASIVFENMYIGETTINPNQTENDLNITLGNDRRISVKRENIKEKSEDKFLSSNRERTVTYDLIIRNNKKETVNIEVKDRFPLSTEESIKVELLEISGAKKDDEKGFLTWNEKIAPSETKKFRVSYKVRYPKSYNLSNF